jgi:predicted amidophosphoribosyltransferase
MTNSTAFAALTSAVAAGWRDLLAVVCPVECAGCGLPDVALCAACLAVFTTGSRHVAVRAWPDGPGVWAAGSYRGLAARLVVAWKDRGRFDLTPGFGTALAGPLVAAAGPFPTDPRSGRGSGRPGGGIGRSPGSGWTFGGDAWPGGSLRLSSAANQGLGGGSEAPLLLVPIPTAPANRRRRGADLVRDLAAAAARAASAGGAWPGAPPRVAPALAHVRRVHDQSGLGAEARRVNIHGALSVTRRWSDRVNGRRVLLVDDIVTTGATMAEAARALAAAGALPVGACCLCVTIRQQGVFARTPLV